MNKVLYYSMITTSASLSGSIVYFMVNNVVKNKENYIPNYKDFVNPGLLLGALVYPSTHILHRTYRCFF